MRFVQRASAPISCVLSVVWWHWVGIVGLFVHSQETVVVVTALVRLLLAFAGCLCQVHSQAAGLALVPPPLRWCHAALEFAPFAQCKRRVPKMRSTIITLWCSHKIFVARHKGVGGWNSPLIRSGWMGVGRA